MATSGGLPRALDLAVAMAAGAHDNIGRGAWENDLLHRVVAAVQP